MIAFIIVGGIIGTLARYFLQGSIQQWSGVVTFPVGTLAINVLGSFVIGFVIRLATGSTIISPDVRAGLTVGFCGAFTTMSTFSYESVKLMGDGEYLFAALYFASTIAGCFAAVMVGTRVAGAML